MKLYLYDFSIFVAAVVISSCAVNTKSQAIKDSDRAPSAVSSVVAVEHKSAVLKQWVLAVKECKSVDDRTYYAAVKVCNLKRTWLVDSGYVWDKEKLVPGSIKDFYEINSVSIVAYDHNYSDKSMTKCEIELASYKAKIVNQNPCDNKIK